MTFVTSVLKAHLSITVLPVQTQLNAVFTLYHVLQIEENMHALLKFLCL